jgi:hypothetical protein
MASDAHMRVVDLLELPEVRKAIDDQMQPRRFESGDLQKAIEHATALREELMERTRDVRNLAELVRQKDETAQALREELAEMAFQVGTQAPSPPASHGSQRSSAHSFGAQSWLFEVASIVTVVVLLIMAVCNGHFLERSTGNELANHQRSAAPVVRKGRPVLSVPNHGAVRRRQHRSGPPAGAR